MLLNLLQESVTMMKKIKFAFFLIFIAGNAFSQDKPNVLWITIEDTSPQFVGCYGNSNAKTPNIDKLAHDGVMFSNAFSTNTVCSPSRTTIITGVRTFENGTGNHRSKSPVPDYMYGFPYYMRQAGYYTTNNKKTDYNVTDEQAFINEAWNQSSSEAGWQNRQPGQPFFAVFNFTDSHQSQTMTAPYSQYKKNVLDKLSEEDRIDDDEFKMPPFYRDTPEMRKQFARIYNSIKLTDNKIGKLLNRLKKDNLTDSTIIIMFSDHGEGIPRGKTNGINLGYRVPFIVWFPPMYRHLSPWGAGLVTDELISFEDLAPTLISLAGGKVPSHMKGRVLIGNKRSEVPTHIILSSDRSDNGIDMIRTITDGRYIYSRNYMPFMPEARFINYMEKGEIKKLMREDLEGNKLNPLQKSLFEARPAEFLFDTKKDLWETNNLAGKPEAQNLLIKMRKELGQQILSRRDIMLLPEYELGQIPKNTTAYEFRLEDDRYPLKEIYHAASLSGMRSRDVAQKQIDLLNSNNKIVRYWAITGLRSQDKSTLQPFKSQLIAAMKDSYTPVSIASAAIVFDVFSDKNAEDILNKRASDTNADLALLTTNFLLYVSNKQPFVTTIKKLINNKETSLNVKWACKDFLESLGLSQK